jgi:hypothetical protein
MKYQVGRVVRAQPRVDLARCALCGYGCGGRIGQIKAIKGDKYVVNFGSGECELYETELELLGRKLRLV